MNCLKILKIKPISLSLYETALTHSSYANENNLDHNERLEFLGDAILELITSEFLYHKFDLNEGEMTKLRSKLVCTDALYNYAIYLGLDKDIKLGAGEKKSYNKSIFADATEALIAAIYLDLGIDIARDVIFGLFEHTELAFNDYKSTLQELVQTTKKSLTYEVIKETGPAHDKTFTVVVKIDNIIYGRGTCGSKKAAEQKAAKQALEKVAK